MVGTSESNIRGGVYHALHLKTLCRRLYLLFKGTLSGGYWRWGLSMLPCRLQVSFNSEEACFSWLMAVQSSRIRLAWIAEFNVRWRRGSRGKLWGRLFPFHCSFSRVCFFQNDNIISRRAYYIYKWALFGRLLVSKYQWSLRPAQLAM